MAEIVNQPNYTIRAAAVRVNRSTRTIEQWVSDGLACRQVAGIVVIDHAALMERYRQRIVANPNRKRVLHDFGI